MDLNDLGVRKLYIWLGLDKIVSLNLDDLKWYPSYNVLSLPTTIGTRYTSGGFFFMDSKLHYLGGFGPQFKFNKNVFSFNLPSFKPDDSTYFPDHSDSKLKPIVFTISNKVYSLSTFPVSDISQPSLFEVYEPHNRKWRSLSAPPIPPLNAITSHCVFRNNLLLQTSYGDFIFDANAETKGWEMTQVYPKCCAVLEYKDDDLLLVLTREPSKLVAYELTSFGEINCLSHVVDIQKKYFDFSKLSIVWASLNYVGNSCVCLVFISSQHNFHVSLFKVFKTNDIICAHVEAYYEFANPVDCSPDYRLHSTFLWCAEEPNQQNPTVSVHDDTLAVSNCERPESHSTEEEMVHNGLEDRSLYIWLGFDSFFSIDLDNLRAYPGDLPTIGTEYTLGGFFSMDSKLHFLGGFRPEQFKFNKKVFSFNFPSFTPYDLTYFPDHSDCKLSPIVFTISNKVYALSTFFPFSEISEPIFEVYEPEFGKWRSLPAPPIAALYTIINHCVFRNKLLLQTHYGDFIFDANAVTKGWERTQVYPKCCAVLEYKDLLLVLTREPFKLVVYELKSFGEINCSSHVVDIEKDYFDFSKLNIVWASLNHVGNNCFCLVFISRCYDFHVSLFKVLKADDIIYGHVKAYNTFVTPIRRTPEIHHYSTFFC